MKKKDLEKKIADLEKRVQELEQRPFFVTYPVYQPIPTLIPTPPAWRPLHDPHCIPWPRGYEIICSGHNAVMGSSGMAEFTTRDSSAISPEVVAGFFGSALDS